MTHNTPKHDQTEGLRHSTTRRTADAPPQGRLVLVLEHELSDASRITLHNVLERIMPYKDVTMISGLSRASMLQAEQMGNGLFYNRKEYLAPEQAFRMLPWREVWVISNGLVWTLLPAGI